MHELSIVQSVLGLVKHHLPEGNSGKVTSVKLQIGELSGIEINALRFAFDIARKNGWADEAALNIEYIPGKAHCRDCDSEFHKPTHYTACPECGNYLTDLVAGREMKLLSFELA